MADVDSTFNDLIRTSRPWNGESYDRDCHESNLLAIATDSGLFDTAATVELRLLVAALICEFEIPGFNNWRAHNNFCLGLFNLFKGLRASRLRDSVAA